jgi:hypothetical protein
MWVNRLQLLAVATALFGASFIPYWGSLAFGLLQFTIFGEAFQRFLRWETKGYERLGISAGIGLAVMPLAGVICQISCIYWFVIIYITTAVLAVVSKPHHVELKLEIDMVSLVVYFILLWTSLITIYLVRNPLIYVLLTLYVSILLFINFRYKSQLLQIFTMIYIYMLVNVESYLIGIISEMFNAGRLIKIPTTYSSFFGYVGLQYIAGFYQYNSLFSLAMLFYQFLFMNLILSKLFNDKFIYKPLAVLILAKYGFIASWLFGLYAIYNSLKGRTFLSLSALLLSSLFGTRGLILGGLPVILSLLKDRKSLVITSVIGIILVATLNKYIQNYYNILYSFSKSFQLDPINILNLVVQFFIRNRLQPQLDFFILVIVYILPILLSLFFIKRRNREIIILIVSTIILFIMFGITMLFRLSIFENFASDIPYYFLYPSSFLAILILSKVLNRRFYKLFLILIVFFFIASVPKFFYQQFYENIFTNYVNYFSLLVVFDRVYVKGTLLYDYGSYPFSANLAKYNAIITSEWATSDRYLSQKGPIFYLGSPAIANYPMYFYLPHVQKSWLNVLRNKIIDSGQYAVFLLES